MVYQKNHSKNSIFEELKLQILQGLFKPRERLLERDLAIRFGVSRTPIREALRKLESLGMVKIAHNQGAQVADFSLQDIEDLYLIRLDLEKLAARLATAHVTPQELQSLSGINQRLLAASLAKDFHKMVEFDQLFHRTLIQICNNQFLIKILEEIRLKSYAISYYIWKNGKNIKTSIREHDRIVYALRKKDGKKIEELIEMQLNNSKSFYVNVLSEK